MGKKRGKFSLNGVGTKMEQHAERVLRLVKLGSPHADPLAYASLLFLETRDPERFKTLMSEAMVAALYDRFKTRRKAREQARVDAAEQTQPETKRGEVSAERRRRKLALNDEGTLTEQHVDRVKRLWSVLLERNHNMYQYKTRVAFAASMQWLEENQLKTFLTLLESLEDMSNGDDAYFIFLRHELNQIQKRVAASHAKIDLDILAPTRRRKTETPGDVTTSTEAMHPDQRTIFDLVEGNS
ncbi:hypothetical protein F4Z99_02335 [Candidatus Poribacteria bacterium]|nr:hypothetical protein [Candidatus Poribacteria bacterium]MYB01849.1 hypothetical protein [Candidatus Poribacteria bacterium]